MTNLTVIYILQKSIKFIVNYYNVQMMSANLVTLDHWIITTQYAGKYSPLLNFILFTY